MLYRYGTFIHRRARLVLVLAALALTLCTALGIGAFGQLKGGGFNDPHAEATRAEQVIDTQFGGRTNLVFLLHATTGTVDTPAAAATGRTLAQHLSGEPGVDAVVSYWTSNAPALRSHDDTQAIVAVHVTGDDDQSTTRAKQLIVRYAVPSAAATIQAGGGAAASVDINDQVTTSLLRAEAIAVPLTTILLLFVFGSLVAALLPLLVGTIAIMGTFAELYLVGSVTSVSEFSINMTTALGLGLGIDYSLLLVSRFREQLAQGQPVPEALAATVASAGRTVLFAAATVASALTSLLVFPQYFLRSFAYAGIGVVLISAATALLVLPALLSVLGTRVNKGKIPWSAAATRGGESRIWRRTTTAVQRRPARYAVPAVLLLLFLALPLTHAQLGTPDQGVLPKDTSSRQVSDRLAADFSGQGDQVDVVTTTAVPPTALGAYARSLSQLPGVLAVDSSTGSFRDGTPTTPSLDPTTLGRPHAQRLVLSTSLAAKSPAAQDLVAKVRAVSGPAGVDRLVGGPDADLVDTSASIGAHLPYAALIIIASTLLLLFAFTGSLLQPLRALLFNALTLSGTAGVLVWMFQDGHGGGALAFTARPMDMSMLILFLCIAFGLSMDYEVFLISRIKELHDRGMPTAEAVTTGLARTGRIVSAAAALLAVSLLAFAAGTVSFLQMFGIGAGLAIVLDATLVRAVLLPAALRILGDANWYCPAPLRRLHRRIALAEA
ncbi:RND superfamily putative drug exporter [Streptacidiphilus sp. MAP12-16]|uniref:MMPL family transporter n=1 Tax=Streptacidiphilus sp. MAP12-16 TaxID=3156300 RepID=UPI00351101E4